MQGALVVCGLALAWGIPAWKFHFLPAWRGEFPHSPTCPCRECVPS